MDDSVLLLRHVHPNFIQGDKVSSQVFSSLVFKPFPKDKGLLSVYNNEKFTPAESFEHYTDKDLASSGVVAVTVSECTSIELPTNEDNDPFDGHAHIDFTDLSTNQIGKKSKRLKNLANQRGWLYKD